jgi:hypothetical protein
MTEDDLSARLDAIELLIAEAIGDRMAAQPKHIADKLAAVLLCLTFEVRPGPPIDVAFAQHWVAKRQAHVARIVGRAVQFGDEIRDA